MMESQPTTIITDDQIALKAALAELKIQGFYDGAHTLDIFHVLKNLRKKTSRVCFPYYSYLARARNRQEFGRLVEKVSTLEEHQDVLERFLKDAPSYCFALI